MNTYAISKISRREAVSTYLSVLDRAELVRLIVRIVEYRALDIGDLERLSQKKTNIRIPSYVFMKDLGVLESVVKYLKEELHCTYHKIAVLLNRDDRTVWATYRNASRKHSKRFSARKGEFSIPLSILNERRYGVLELIVQYMKDELHYRYHKIALSLERDDSTIWTTYHRAKEKRNGSR